MGDRDSNICAIIRNKSSEEFTASIYPWSQGVFPWLGSVEDFKIGPMGTIYVTDDSSRFRLYIHRDTGARGWLYISNETVVRVAAGAKFDITISNDGKEATKRYLRESDSSDCEELSLHKSQYRQMVAVREGDYMKALAFSDNEFRKLKNLDEDGKHEEVNRTIKERFQRMAKLTHSESVKRIENGEHPLPQFEALTEAYLQLQSWGEIRKDGKVESIGRETCYELPNKNANRGNWKKHRDLVWWGVFIFSLGLGGGGIALAVKTTGLIWSAVSASLTGAGLYGAKRCLNPDLLHRGICDSEDFVKVVKSIGCGATVAGVASAATVGCLYYGTITGTSYVIAGAVGGGVGALVGTTAIDAIEGNFPHLVAESELEGWKLICLPFYYLLRRSPQLAAGCLFGTAGGFVAHLVGCQLSVEAVDIAASTSALASLSPKTTIAIWSVSRSAAFSISKIIGEVIEKKEVSWGSAVTDIGSCALFSLLNPMLLEKCVPIKTPLRILTDTYSDVLNHSRPAAMSTNSHKSYRSIEYSSEKYTSLVSIFV